MTCAALSNQHHLRIRKRCGSKEWMSALLNSLDLASTICRTRFESRRSQFRYVSRLFRKSSGLCYDVLLFLVRWMASGMSLRQFQKCMRRRKDAVPFAGHFVAKSSSLTLLNWSVRGSYCYVTQCSKRARFCTNCGTEMFRCEILLRFAVPIWGRVSKGMSCGTQLHSHLVPGLEFRSSSSTFV